MPLCLLVLQTGNLGPLFRSNMFNQIGSWLWPAVCAYPLLRAILATSVSFLIPLSIALVTSVLIIGLARYLFYCWNYGIFRKSTAAGDQIPCQVSDHVKMNNNFDWKELCDFIYQKTVFRGSVVDYSSLRGDSYCLSLQASLLQLDLSSPLSPSGFYSVLLYLFIYLTASLLLFYCLFSIFSKARG